MIKKIVLSLGALVVGAAAFLVWQIGPRNVIGMIRYDQRRDGDLKVGDRAPAAMLVALDGTSRQPMLAAGKPTVLVFGSFT
ncbi:MAG TPA: hypothetical protein VF266_27550 [Thermoanaerobaculia bacterium]